LIRLFKHPLTAELSGRNNFRSQAKYYNFVRSNDLLCGDRLSIS